MKRILITACVLAAGAAALAKDVAGAAPGYNSGYATDQYPGFEDLDKLPKPEKKETSWFLWTSRDTAKEQLEYARQMEAEGSLRAARRGFDALVREWPASPEAPVAQLALAKVLEREESYDDAFEEYAYLVDFFPRECDYAGIVTHMYKLANVMVKNKSTFLGLSFTSTRQLRQCYEIVVRHAPAAEYVPDAYLRIAALREEDSHYEEAVEVYGALMNKHPDSVQAHRAAYLNASARMWLARRHAYNMPRLQDTKNFLRSVLKSAPEHEHAEEMRAWLTEVTDYLAEDDWRKTVFYDSNQRTKHAAASAYDRFLRQYPESSHAEEARARIAAITAARVPQPAVPETAGEKTEEKK